MRSGDLRLEQFSLSFSYVISLNLLLLSIKLVTFFFVYMCLVLGTEMLALLFHLGFIFLDLLNYVIFSLVLFLLHSV